MIAHLRPTPIDPQEALDILDRRVSELTATLAATVAERAEAAERARERIRASARVAFTLSEAAAAVGASRQTVEAWTRLADDPLPFLVIDGGVKRVLCEDLVAFLMRRRRNSR